MNYDVNSFAWQWPVLRDFALHYVSYQEINHLLDNMDAKQFKEFWVLTNDAHLLQAINYWCMVFGTAGSNPVHWKKVVEQHEDFRKIIIDIRPDWENYWKEIIDFRNKYSAHREIQFDDPVPLLGDALEIAFAYDGWIRDYIKPDRLEGPTLKEIATEYRENVATSLIKLK
jgi:hypothetical protein